MPSRTVHATPERWKELAAVVRRRRLKLKLTQADAVARSGGRISLPVWSILENARQAKGAMAAESLEGASVALGLEPSELEDLAELPSERLAASSPNSWADDEAVRALAEQANIDIAASYDDLAAVERGFVEGVRLTLRRMSQEGDDFALAADADTLEGDAPTSYQNRPSPPAEDGEHLEG